MAARLVDASSFLVAGGVFCYSVYQFISLSSLDSLGSLEEKQEQEQEQEQKGNSENLSHLSTFRIFVGNKHNKKYPRKLEYTYNRGDAVFVRLNSDKHTGGGRVIDSGDSAPETKATSTSREGQAIVNQKTTPSRVLVRYDHDGSTYNVRQTKVVPRFQRPGIVLTRNTLEYRQLARSQVLGTDSVAELGCSTGECTRVLAQHASRVIGVDISESCISECRAAFDASAAAKAKAVQAKAGKTRKAAAPSSEIEFHAMDVLVQQQNFLKLMKGDGLKRPVDVVFMDIGGDRGLDAVVQLYKFIMRYLPSVKLIVIKSEKMFDLTLATALEVEKTMGTNFFEPDGAVAPHQLGQLLATFDEKTGANRAGGRVAHLHPNKYGERRVGDKFICRFHNYSKCKKQAKCPFDHDHCHKCGGPGHKALVCGEEMASGF